MGGMRALVTQLTLSLALGACASDSELDAASIEVTRGLLRFSEQYSAYDGEHTYPVVVGISRAALPTESDVDWPSVRWIFDESFVEQTDYRVLDGTAGDDFIPVRKYDSLTGTAVFTTQRTGRTVISVVFRTRSGEPMHGEATLQISRASAEEWALGESYLKQGRPIFDFDRDVMVESNSCMDCHNPTLGFSPCTPLQTAGYTDDELLGTMSRGELPPALVSWSGYLQSRPDPERVFEELHSPDDIDDGTARGLLWKFRSLLPEVPKELDLGFATPVGEREE